MILSLYTAPTVEPIHLTEAKLHLRAGGSVDEATALLYTSENSTIGSFISAARIAAETEQWRGLVLQTWDYYPDAFPGGDFIELPLPPLRAVVVFEYTDSSGVTLPFTDYTLDTVSEPGRVVLDADASWPSVELANSKAIHIRLQCGYLVPFIKSSSTIAKPTDHPFAVGDRVRLSVSGGTLPAPLSSTVDYFITATGLSLTSGGADVVVSADGTGTYFLGVLPESTKIGMKLIITDLYEERGDTIIGRSTNSLPVTIPRGASHWFSMDTAKRF